MDKLILSTTMVSKYKRRVEFLFQLCSNPLHESMVKSIDALMARNVFHKLGMNEVAFSTGSYMQFEKNTFIKNTKAQLYERRRNKDYYFRLWLSKLAYIPYQERQNYFLGKCSCASRSYSNRSMEENCNETHTFNAPLSDIHSLQQNLGNNNQDKQKQVPSVENGNIPLSINKSQYPFYDYLHNELRKHVMEARDSTVENSESPFIQDRTMDTQSLDRLHFNLPLQWSDKDKSKFLYEMVEAWDGMISSRKEALKVCSLFGWTKDYTQQIITRAQQVKRTSNPNVNLSLREAKEKIQKWLEDHDYQNPNHVARVELRKQTGLNAIQLSRQIQLLRDRNKPITYEAKKIIQDWCADHFGRKPTQEEKETLLQKTGLGRAQLHNLLSYYKEVKGNVTLQKRMFIHQYLQKFYDSEHLTSVSQVSPEHIQELSEEYELTSIQVRGIIESFILKRHASKITEIQKEHVRKWLKEHNYESPSREARQQLVKATKLRPKQLSSLISRLQHLYNGMEHDSSGQLPIIPKEILQQWLQNHDYRSPNSLERDALQSVTGLSRIQLNDQISYMRNKSKQQGRLSFYTKHMILTQIREWNVKDTSLVTDEQYETLCNQTQLTKKQIREYLKRNEKYLN